MEQAISLTVTDAQLERLADCAHRMPDYADADDSLLITVLQSDNGTPVRISLDKQCLGRSPPCYVRSLSIKKTWR